MKPSLVLALCLATSGCAQFLDGDHDYVLGGSTASSSASGGGPAATSTDSGGEGGSTATTSTISTLTCKGGRTACGVSCVDLSIDPTNCGYCDHDCQGASCDDGLCAPTEMVSDLCFPDTLAVDLTHVFFSTAASAECSAGTGAIQRIAKAGGSPPDVLSTKVAFPNSLRLFEGHAYWADRAKKVLQSCAKNGIGATVTLSETYPFLDRIDVSEAGVYFAMSWSDPSGSTPGAIGRVPLTGGPTTWLAQNLSRPHFLFVTSDAIYFGGSSPAEGPTPEKGFVASMPVNGGSTTVLADQELLPQGVIADSTAVYWANGKLKAIRKKTLPNGPVVTLAEGQEDVHVLEQDDAHIYWTTLSGGVIARVNKLGGATEILASGRERPFGLGVDSKRVYWTESMPSGRVMSAPK